MTANSDDNDDQNNTDHDNSRLETKTKLILIRTKRYSQIYSLMAMLIFISTVLVLYTSPHLHPSHKKNYLADTAWGHGHIVCVHHVVLPARIIYEKKPLSLYFWEVCIDIYLLFVLQPANDTMGVDTNEKATSQQCMFGPRLVHIGRQRGGRWWWGEAPKNHTAS